MFDVSRVQKTFTIKLNHPRTLLQQLSITTDRVSANTNNSRLSFKRDGFPPTIMSQTQISNKLSSTITNAITEIIEKHSTVSSALRDVQEQFTFTSERWYHIIIELMKNNGNIRLIDDMKNANDINEETEIDSIISSMNEVEIRTLQKTLNDNEQSLVTIS